LDNKITKNVTARNGNQFIDQQHVMSAGI